MSDSAKTYAKIKVNANDTKIASLKHGSVEIGTVVKDSEGYKFIGDATAVSQIGATKDGALVYNPDT
jgi:hypothetical protein